MENIEIEIPMQVLDAATFCAAKNDVRFYLNGVAIDKGHVVATDGCRAFACELENVGKDLPQILIPTESVKAFIKKVPTKLRKANCKVIFDPRAKKGEIIFEQRDGRIIEYAREFFVGHDGKYPDWQRIFPRGVDSEYKGHYPTFNWSYMADFQKMHKALGGNGLQVLLYPTSVNAVALVEFNDTKFFSNAKACIMPLRA